MVVNTRSILSNESTPKKTVPKLSTKNIEWITIDAGEPTH
jgi:hypothetical protein